MGVLEVVIISLVVIFFFAITGLSGLTRLVSWIIAGIERVLFSNIVEDEDGHEEKNN